MIVLHSNSTSDASQGPLRHTTPHRMLTLVAASTRWSATTAAWLSRPCHALSPHGFQMASMMINHPILPANEAANADSPVAMSAFPPSDFANTVLHSILLYFLLILLICMNYLFMTTLIVQVLFLFYWMSDIVCTKACVCDALEKRRSHKKPCSFMTIWLIVNGMLQILYGIFFVLCFQAYCFCGFMSTMGYISNNNNNKKNHILMTKYMVNVLVPPLSLSVNSLWEVRSSVCVAIGDILRLLLFLIKCLLKLCVTL